jgi:hypothetical protein
MFGRPEALSLLHASFPHPHPAVITVLKFLNRQGRESIAAYIPPKPLDFDVRMLKP